MKRKEKREREKTLKQRDRESWRERGTPNSVNVSAPWRDACAHSACSERKKRKDGEENGPADRFESELSVNALLLAHCAPVFLSDD